MASIYLELNSLSNAVTSLSAAIARPKDEFIRDSVIQRFEYTYDLCWKFLARFLEADIGSEEIDRLSRKDLFRIGAEKGYINDMVQISYNKKSIVPYLSRIHC